MSWERISGFRLVTPDPLALARFYAALGCTVGTLAPIDPAELRLLGLGGRGRRLPLCLGPSRIALDHYDVPGRPIAPVAEGTGQDFQHLAFVTTDIAAAWGRALAAGATPVSTSGPVTLPPAAGGVTAIKFRDPDGHPLELLQFPPGGSGAWPAGGTGDVLGIDHSAIVTRDRDASVAFYAGHGLRPDAASLNHGPEQAALDGLVSPLVAVVPLQPPSAPPHVELLAYRRPAPQPAAWSVADHGATRIVWQSAATALVRDPDGHLHQTAPD